LLDRQHEIGLRHQRSKKNVSDGAASTAIVPLRDLLTLAVPITTTLRRSSRTRATAPPTSTAWRPRG